MKAETKARKEAQKRADIVTLHKFMDVVESLLINTAIDNLIDREEKRVLIDTERTLKRLLSL